MDGRAKIDPEELLDVLAAYTALENGSPKLRGSKFATRFVRFIIPLLSNDILDAVDDHWTGHTRIRPSHLDQRSKVYVQFRISLHTNLAWEQVREIKYLAATDDAGDPLIEHAGIRGAICVQWVLFARQPLSLEQLYFAVLSGVEPNTPLRCDPDKTSIDIIKRFILDSSKGFTETTTSKAPAVQFIRELVKDSLLKENGSDQGVAG
ncbi:hypothetical protein K469DRAFT_688383 [Zopfia rhizophila CBS 207.26]|uniref:Uncharacterized protein n=1 Tax=Zopfia rhizophila CBS 207.26 TaxID=1314779 RepID=A0A6A6E0J7_9PEZI|nr:hypothetical protein K469DRAFT_688383 [Zopfia rhizophila CBS 207.26]